MVRFKILLSDPRITLLHRKRIVNDICPIYGYSHLNWSPTGWTTVPDLLKTFQETGTRDFTSILESRVKQHGQGFVLRRWIADDKSVRHRGLTDVCESNLFGTITSDRKSACFVRICDLGTPFTLVVI